jgi:hypothetical protein
VLMSSASSRNGSEFERALLSALGFSDSDDASSATQRAADSAARSIIEHFGAAPDRCRPGIGGQWVLTVEGADQAVAVALRSDDLRHPRPQGLARALGFQLRTPPHAELTEAMQSAASRFRDAAGSAGRFKDLDPAITKRLYRDVNSAVVRWIERHVAGIPDRVHVLWTHATGGAYLHVVARSRTITIDDRRSLSSPDSIRLVPADASRIVATFSNGDRVVLRLHTASKEYRATGQISLKYAVTAAPAGELQEWLFDDEPIEDTATQDGIADLECVVEQIPAATSHSLRTSNRHAGRCFEMLACRSLQRSFGVEGDQFTADAQARDLARLPTLPADTRRRLERASVLLASWADDRWGGFATGPPARIVRLPDSAGEAGDTADVRIEGDAGESLAFSLKHNNDVLKNHRPWNLPSQCGLNPSSPEHGRWTNRLREIVSPTERVLIDGRVDRLSRADRLALYRRVTQATADSLTSWSRIGVPELGARLCRFLFGREDTFVVIAWLGQLEIRRYAGSASTTTICGIDALGSQLLVQFSSGHTTRWRVHTDSRVRRGGQFPLKWDARATSAAEHSEMFPL